MATVISEHQVTMASSYDDRVGNSIPTAVVNAGYNACTAKDRWPQPGGSLQQCSSSA